LPHWLPGDAQLFLCQVHNPQHEEMDARPLEEAINQLQDRFGGELVPLCLRSPFVAETLIQLVQDRAIDGVILGASGQSLLQQTLYGNLPNQVLKSVPCTVAILRAPLDSGLSTGDRREEVKA
jgi:CIC family chloride channel protein